LIQTASLFKNILGSLSKGGKNYKKNIIKNVGFYGKTLGDHGQKIYGTFGRLSDALSFAK